MSTDNGRKEELLAAARDRLTQREDEAAAEPTPSSSSRSGGDAELMYRGKAIRRGTGATPGAPSAGAPRSGDADRTAQIRVALQQIKDDYSEGLITRTEAERRRAGVMERP